MIQLFRPLTINFYRIYVECDNYNKCYIGSTKKNINTRFSEHKSSYLSSKTQFHNSACELFKYGYDNNKNIKIELLESITLENNEDIKFICDKENEYINKYKDDVVNKRKAKR